LRVEFPDSGESQELQRPISIQNEEEIKKRKEISIYDISLEQPSLQNKLSILDTKVKEIVNPQIYSNLFDISIFQGFKIQYIQIPSTNLNQISPSIHKAEISDIKLLSANIKILNSFNTDLKEIKQEIIKTKSLSNFDVNILKSEEIAKEIGPIIKLDTQLTTVNIQSGLEILSNSHEQLPIFEDFIKCNKRFPRGFSESFNSPFVVLIGEDKKEWHIPIIYSLKELFREITDKYPKITFREPEIIEEGFEENVDSIDLHSLDQFTFESKIEFLDARREYFTVDEFVKIVRGRLKSSFLQQFGVLIIAVKSKNLEKAEEALKIEGLQVYVSSPKDEDYEIFCSKILGLDFSENFFDTLRKNERYLELTNKLISIFVKRGSDANDKYQYPLKVATFLYLLNELIGRRKILINNLEEFYKLTNEIITDGKIKVEYPISDGKIIPDIIYSPGDKDIYIEIETLIGTIEPLKKIDETIEKYKNECTGISCNIWVILKPVSAFLHYEELKARDSAYKILYSDKIIKFKVLTLLISKERFKWNLMDIDEFVRRNNVR